MDVTFARVLQAESCLFDKQNWTIPAQLKAIHELCWGQSEQIQEQSRRFCDMLTEMLHPEAQERKTAKQMHNLKWLRAAAKVSLYGPSQLSCTLYSYLVSGAFF